MIEWLRLFFHIHKWEIIAKGVYYVGDNPKLNHSGRWYDASCKICGKVKRFNS